MHNRLKIVMILVFALTSVSAIQAETEQVPNNPDGAVVNSMESVAEAKRRKELESAIEVIRQGKDLAAKGKYKEAYAKLMSAKKTISNIGGDKSALKLKLLNEYLGTFRIDWATAIMDEAYAAFGKNNYDLAVIKAREAQSLESLPEDKKDKIQDFVDLCQKRIDSREYKKVTALEYKDVDPDNKIRNREIDVAMRQANIFMKNHQYERARDTLEKVLVRDPYNFEATDKLDKLYHRLLDVAEIRKESDLYERLTNVEWKWSEPVLPVPAKRPDKAETTEDKGNGSLMEKMKRLVMKDVDFTDANIQSVVNFLAKESKRIDAVNGTGINIILGLEDKEVANIPLVTMKLENIPLNEVIRYLCQMCHLKYRIEGQVLTIGNDSIDEMDTRFFKVRAALINRIAPIESADTGGDTGGGDDMSTGDDFFDPTTSMTEGGKTSSKRNITSEALKSYFEERGVPFPEGAKIAYSRRSGKLTVKNTHENLRRLDTLLRALDIQQPQVLIESKFLETSETSLEEMGFEWWINPDNSTSQNWWLRPNNTLVRPLGTNQDGVKSPTQLGIGDSGKVINNLMIPALNLGDNFPKFDLHMIMHALDRNTTTEVLSAPKVIAKNGEEATIRMVREEYFPDSWTAPELTIINGQFSYTPPVPEFGEPTDIGIKLIVTPTVSPDNHTITLALNPQVLDIVGWTNYDIDYKFGGSEGSSLVKMPEVSRRDVNATVKTYDGDTLVLGGMITENATGSDDSYPGTNKVPLLGFLGRMQTKKNEKKNLLIFVTARIVNPDGIPVRISAQNGLYDFRR